ncbi:MAG TPA: 30S ribosomal protein THX [Bacteroidales bacterium]|nr:30S ribosomal protein THX [Bacteroidales bacterium]HSA44064.1 30S ribosomal protein THX [Bacteroidales bacterium]
MGKGDKKSRRGKIIIGTYGVRRKKRSAGKYVPAPGGKESGKKEISQVAEPVELSPETAAIPPVTDTEAGPPPAPAPKPARKKAADKLKPAAGDKAAGSEAG